MKGYAISYSMFPVIHSPLRNWTPMVCPAKKHTWITQIKEITTITCHSNWIPVPLQRTCICKSLNPGYLIFVSQIFQCDVLQYIKYFTHTSCKLSKHTVHNFHSTNIWMNMYITRLTNQKAIIIWYIVKIYNPNIIIRR